MDMASDVLQPVGEDTARISWNLRKKIAEYQETFSVLERVRPEEAPPLPPCPPPATQPPLICDFLFYVLLSVQSPSWWPSTVPVSEEVRHLLS